MTMFDALVKATMAEFPGLSREQAESWVREWCELRLELLRGPTGTVVSLLTGGVGRGGYGPVDHRRGSLRRAPGS